MNLLSQFSEVEISPKYYRFFFVTNYSYFLGAIIHLSFIYLFADLNVPFMAKYNIVSTALFFAAFILNRRGWHNLGLILILLEIPTHASLATHFLGWDSGFYVYLMALIPLTFFNPALTNIGKILLAIVIAAFSLALKYYADTHQAAVPISQVILNNLFYINYFFFYVVLAFLSFYYSYAARKSEEALQRSHDQIDQLARTDPLTHLSNRRDTLEQLEKMRASDRERDQPLAILLADIDNFKSFNDSYGHECGDFVLVAVADRFKQLLRPTDHIGRWGGEEFIILLPHSGVDTAKLIAEKLRHEISQDELEFNHHRHRISLTFGIAICQKNTDIQRCINQADKSLYAGKQAGKNQVHYLEAQA